MDIDSDMMITVLLVVMEIYMDFFNCRTTIRIDR
jgi:hypothetical protein